MGGGLVYRGRSQPCVCLHRVQLSENLGCMHKPHLFPGTGSMLHKVDWLLASYSHNDLRNGTWNGRPGSCLLCTWSTTVAFHLSESTNLTGIRDSKSLPAQQWLWLAIWMLVQLSCLCHNEMSHSLGCPRGSSSKRSLTQRNKETRQVGASHPIRLVSAIISNPLRKVSWLGKMLDFKSPCSQSALIPSSTCR